MIEFERTDDPLLRDVPLEHRVLAENGGWALDVGSRPDAAIPFLFEMFDEIDQRSAED